ncbi:hypothetical protein NWQ33_05235 [Mycoplasmopsis cynos]|nr:hypothetical protein [Mycoplasmopsis cynos]
MQIQNRLNGWFKQNNLNDEAVNYHPTSTYILNKSSLDEFKETSHQNIAELNKIRENAEKILFQLSKILKALIIQIHKTIPPLLTKQSLLIILVLVFLTQIQ